MSRITYATWVRTIRHSATRKRTTTWTTRTERSICTIIGRNTLNLRLSWLRFLIRPRFSNGCRVVWILDDFFFPTSAFTFLNFFHILCTLFVLLILFLGYFLAVEKAFKVNVLHDLRFCGYATPMATVYFFDYASLSLNKDGYILYKYETLVTWTGGGYDINSPNCAWCELIW